MWCLNKWRVLNVFLVGLNDKPRVNIGYEIKKYMRMNVGQRKSASVVPRVPVNRIGTV